MFRKTISQEDLCKIKEYIHARYAKPTIYKYSVHNIDSFDAHEQLSLLIPALFDIEPNSFLKFFYTVGPSQDDVLGLAYSEQQELADLENMHSLDHQLNLTCSINHKKEDTLHLQDYVSTLVNQIMIEHKVGMFPLVNLYPDAKDATVFDLLQSVYVKPYDFFSWAKAKQFSLPTVIEQKLKEYHDTLKQIPTSGLALVFRDEESCKKTLMREVEYLLSEVEPFIENDKSKRMYGEILYIGLASLQGIGCRAIGMTPSPYFSSRSEKTVTEKLKKFHEIIFSLYGLDSRRFSPQSPTEMAKGKKSKGGMA